MAPTAPRTVTRRNAAFQQWQALLTNRTKRHRSGVFLVQGVRPITVAVEHGWAVPTVLVADHRQLSGWARDVLDRVGDAERVSVSPHLLAELAEKDADQEGGPELVALVARPDDDLDRIPVGPRMLVVVFDRPSSPGNVGSLIRSADAFGAAGVVVTGHAADVYDPRAVRASTGSLFAVPVVRAPSHREVVAWAEGLTTGAGPVALLGTDEAGTRDLDAHDLTGPVVVVIGNETRGLSAAWRDRCDHLLRIPISGAASSLNAANAATVVLYEAARQRARLHRPVSDPGRGADPDG